MVYSACACAWLSYALRFSADETPGQQFYGWHLFNGTRIPGRRATPGAACTARQRRTPLRIRRAAPTVRGHHCTRWAVPVTPAAKRMQPHRPALGRRSCIRGIPSAAPSAAAATAAARSCMPCRTARPGPRPVARRPWCCQKARAAEQRRAIAASRAGEHPVLLRQSAMAQAGLAAIHSRRQVVAQAAGSRRAR